MSFKSLIQWKWNGPLVLILTLAAAVRVFGISHGLPQVYYSDECHYVFWAINMGGGDLNPHQFLHPSFYLYLCLGAFVLWSAAAFAVGVIHSTSEVWTFYLKHPEVFYTLARGVSAAAGVASVWLIYRAARRLWNQETGLAAAFFLACSYLHVLYSQIAYIDATLTFLVLTAFTVSLWAVRKRSALSFLCAGIFSGLAFATKYNAIPVFLYGPAAALAASWDARSGELRAGAFLRWTFIYSAGLVVGFTLGTPFWILDFPAFRRDWNLVFFAYQPGEGLHQLGFSGKWNWAYYILQPFRYGLGWPLELCGILGLLLALKERRFLLLVFPAAYFFITGLIQIRLARYGLPLVPFFCLGAAHFLNQVLSRLVSQPLRRIGWFLLCGMVILPSLESTVRFTYLKTKPDTRELAAEWMRRNIPEGSKILVSGYSQAGEIDARWPVAELDATLFDIRGGQKTILKSLSQLRHEGYDYLILDAWHVDSLLKGVKDSELYADRVARYRVFMEELGRDAALKAVFSPNSGPEAVPFSFENVGFPSQYLSQTAALGPEMRIYHIESPAPQAVR